jgi:3-hydroxyacyl-[acyl-carrier-protein] dehydratase
MNLEYFQMIDRIVALDPDAGKIQALCAVPERSPVFEGHFPGYPILPGALMIETMAQAGGWLILAHLNFTRMAFLTRVEAAKIRRIVEPGEQLDAAATLVHDGSGFAVIEGTISRAGQTVASAQIRYAVSAFPNDAIRDAMLTKARVIGFPEDRMHPEGREHAN